MSVDRVIMVCSRKDLLSWKFCAKYIVQNIRSKAYELIVPDRDLELFYSASPSQITVLPESDYIASDLLPLKRAIAGKQVSRTGWYLQQIIKLRALERHAGEDRLLIWDADTAPFKELTFFSDTKRLVKYFAASKIHTPYFEANRRILGEFGDVRRSYIAQCFPIYGAWVRELINIISENTGNDWIEGIISQIDFSEGSGFSEYELLGCFLQQNHPEAMCFDGRPWCRRGVRVFGGIRPPGNYLERQFCFAAFEEWDKPKEGIGRLLSLFREVVVNANFVRLVIPPRF